jgi:hypothetical protein
VQDTVRETPFFLVFNFQTTVRALFAAEEFSYERITKYFLRQIVLDD